MKNIVFNKLKLNLNWYLQRLCVNIKDLIWLQTQVDAQVQKDFFLGW